MDELFVYDSVYYLFKVTDKVYEVDMLQCFHMDLLRLCSLFVLFTQFGHVYTLDGHHCRNT